LERIPLATQRLPSLDGLRAVSIALVIGSHAIGMFGVPPWLQPLTFIINGGLGVRIFFCISGFLITYLLLQERKRTGSIDLKSFYVRRALRIVPANYLFIAVLVAISLAGWIKIPTCNLLTAITYTKNYGCGGPLEGHLWSLAVEEQFYLLWPFAVVCCSAPRALTIACLLCLIAPISRAAEYLLGNSPFTWLPSNADGLMVRH
jgi:peptidoglycan/LPS O-acetylase OafA/YrhL